MKVKNIGDQVEILLHKFLCQSTYVSPKCMTRGSTVLELQQVKFHMFDLENDGQGHL